MYLNDLKPGQSGRILTVGGEGALRQHFLDMGVIPGTDVTHSVVLIEKLRPTPAKYPRRYAQIKKQPL